MVDDDSCRHSFGRWNRKKPEIIRKKKTENLSNQIIYPIHSISRHFQKLEWNMQTSVCPVFYDFLNVRTMYCDNSSWNRHIQIIWKMAEKNCPPNNYRQKNFNGQKMCWRKKCQPKIVLTKRISAKNCVGQPNVAQINRRPNLKKRLSGLLLFIFDSTLSNQSFHRKPKSTTKNKI